MRKKYKRKPLIARFMKFVKPNLQTGCWEWQGYLKIQYRNGKRDLPYGHFSIDSRPVRAHRWAYEYFIDKIPDDLEIDHLCKNTICVNPFHLEPVPQEINNLRSNSLSSQNLKKTHCKRGHEFTPENIYIVKRKGRKDGRSCKICQLKRAKHSNKKPGLLDRAPESP